MIGFLSEENIAMHREYARKKALLYSIIESSIPKLKGAEVNDLFRMRLSERDRREAILLLSEIRLHELFFSSFSDKRFLQSDFLSSSYGSESAFLNEVYKIAIKLNYGFVCVFCWNKKVEVRAFEHITDAYSSGVPKLCVDVCEHAYFMDYGFDKERYLYAALPYLDIKKLNCTEERSV